MGKDKIINCRLILISHTAEREEGESFSEKPLGFKIFVVGDSSVKIKGHNTFRYGSVAKFSVAFESDTISDGAQLRLYYLGRTWNSGGYICTSGLGECSFPLIKMVHCFENGENFMERNACEKGSHQTGFEKILKASIRLEFDCSFVPSFRKDPYTFVGKEKKAVINEAIKKVITRTFVDVQRSSLEPTMKDVCEFIRCPEFVLPPGRLLPGSTYCLYGLDKPGHVPCEFYVHLLNQACCNLLVDKDTIWDAFKTDDSFFEHHEIAGVFMVEMICRPSWAMIYLDDFTNANRDDQGSNYSQKKIDRTWCDIFKNLFVFLCGDCEDMEWGILRLFRGLTTLFNAKQQSTTGDESRDVQILKRMSLVFEKFYSFLMIQSGASRSKASRFLSYETSTEESRSSHVKNPYGINADPKTIRSHTLGCIVPQRYFYDCLERGSEIYGKGDNPKRPMNLPLRKDNYQNDPLERDKKLFPLMCEGTYPTFPLLRQKMKRSPLLERWSCSDDFVTLINSRFKRMYELDAIKTIEDDPNDRFCKIYVRGFTDHFYVRGCLSCDFCFIRREHPHSPYTYGIWTNELLECSDNVGIFAYGEWNEKEDKMIQSLLKDEDRSTRLMPIDMNTILEEKNEWINAALLLSKIRTVPSNPPHSYVRVSYFIKSAEPNPVSRVQDVIDIWEGNKNYDCFDIVGFDFEFLTTMKTDCILLEPLFELRVDFYCNKK